MKGLVCLLLLLETFVFVVGGLNEHEISQLHSSKDKSQNPPQTDFLRDEASTDSQQTVPDIYAALRELTAAVTEQKENIRDLEKQLDEMNKKNDETCNLTLSQVEELRKEIRDREIAFSASLMESGNHGYTGPFKTDITLTYRNVFTNIGNAYNPVTGIFTAPLKGAYMFRFTLHGHGEATETASINKNGNQVVVVHDVQVLAKDRVNSSNGVVLILEVGDVVSVKLWSGSKIYDNQNNLNTFSGYLLFPLR